MNTFVFVGTYTQINKTDHRTEGIYAYRFDTVSGKLSLSAASHAGLNPSFVRLHPGGKFLYAANETMEGQVSALAVDPATGALSLLNNQPTNGAHPCYVSLDPDGRFLLTANYSSGSVAAYPVAGDGRLGAMSGFVEHAGSGWDRKRQERAHAHSIAFDLSGKHVLAADLGIDRILVYRLDPTTGQLSFGALWGAAMRPGAGPRHFACHPNGKVIYVANELDSTVTACSWDANSGSLAPFQNLSTLGDNFTGENAVADIHLNERTSTLYVSNRGDNSLAVFRIVPGGALERLGIISCGGNWPRNFALDPGGQWLLCANQFSDSITIFRIDPQGIPVNSGEMVKVPAPVCLEFGEY